MTRPGQARSDRAPISGWVRLVFLGLFVSILLKVVDFGDALAVLSRIDLRWLVPVFGLFALGQILSSARWRLSLAQMVPEPPRLGTLLRLYLIGLFINLGLPTLAGGDVVRAEMVRGMLGARAGAYASILADRLIGVVAVAGLAAAALVLASGRIGPEMRGPVTVGILLLLLGTAVAVAMLGFGMAGRWRRLDPFLDALRALARRPRILALCLAVAVTVQVVAVILPIAMLAHALGIALPLGTHFLLVPIIVLATLVPIAPNGLGLREAAFVLLYGHVGVSAEAAFALGLSWSLVLTAFGLAGGLILALGKRTTTAPR